MTSSDETASPATGPIDGARRPGRAPAARSGDRQRPTGVRVALACAALQRRHHRPAARRRARRAGRLRRRPRRRDRRLGAGRLRAAAGRPALRRRRRGRRGRSASARSSAGDTRPLRLRGRRVRGRAAAGRSSTPACRSSSASSPPTPSTRPWSGRGRTRSNKGREAAVTAVEMVDLAPSSPVARPERCRSAT